MTAARLAIRAHALDGARLFFQPATGVHVRVEHAGTRALRRAAPRVAMFGITNACNLRCDFCSRDPARDSAWTVASAAAVLRGLCDAGTLEVAYGGGEPFAFRGFAELVEELDATTVLAQHVTTNGTLIEPAMWRRFAGRFGQVRISIYDDAWERAVDVIAGQRWGANLIVDHAALASLPALLARLTARGCHDASLLAYVGPDAARHLDAGGERRLARIIEDSPVACRLSVCFGDRIAVPRLFGGDCGAGHDFVSITPDARVQSCSFQDRSLPGATAAEVLAAWRTQQPLLAAPSPRRGCARVLPLAREPAAPPIAVWQSFSGNNSGECFLVARFEHTADAEAYLAELLPDLDPDASIAAAWRKLFADEGVAPTSWAAAFDDDDGRGHDRDLSFDAWQCAREVVAIGRSVVAVQYDAIDPFPYLRALAWKRGAFVVPGGVHVHDGFTLLAAIRCAGDLDRGRVLAMPVPAAMRRYPHGDAVLVVAPILEKDTPLATLAGVRDAVLALAGERRFAVELYFEEVTDATLVAAKKQLGHAPVQRPRLWVTFWRPNREKTPAERARALAEACRADRTTLVDSSVLVDPAPDRKRLAVIAYRGGAAVAALDGEEVAVETSVWFEPLPPRKGRRAPKPPTVDIPAFQTALGAALPSADRVTVAIADRSWRPGAEVSIITTQPGRALTAIAGNVERLGARHWPYVRDREPLAAALRRLLDDVR